MWQLLFLKCLLFHRFVAGAALLICAPPVNSAQNAYFLRVSLRYEPRKKSSRTLIERRLIFRDHLILNAVARLAARSIYSSPSDVLPLLLVARLNQHAHLGGVPVSRPVP